MGLKDLYGLQGWAKTCSLGPSIKYTVPHPAIGPGSSGADRYRPRHGTSIENKLYGIDSDLQFRDLINRQAHPVPGKVLLHQLLLLLLQAPQVLLT